MAMITGIAHDRSEAKITVTGVPDTPGESAQIFRAVADAEVDIDMVVQNVSPVTGNRTDLTFTVPKADGPRTVKALEKARRAISFDQVLIDEHIGKVSLIGAGMRSHPGVTATFCEALGSAGVNIEIISTSEIRISVICRDTRVDEAVRALHEAFELGGDELAEVYAGSGR